MRVLITGAGGFIGSHLICKFQEKGFICEGWGRQALADTLFSYKQINLCDRESVEISLGQFEPDIIVHCAGNADVGSSVLLPEADFDSNVAGTHNLLFSMQKQKLQKKRFVFLSSAAVYGNPEVLPVREDAGKKPLSPYALHKQMCEDICFYFMKNFDFDIKIARIFSAYGGGLRKQIFWDMANKARYFQKLEMFGSGTETRDFIHIDDLVEILYLICIQQFEESVLNIANGRGVAIKQVAELFAEKYGLGRNKVWFTGKVKMENPVKWEADISKIMALGYRQKVSLEEGIHKYVNWVLQLKE